MIYDKVTNINNYCKENDKLLKAIEFFNNFDSSKPDGEYEVEGREIIANVQSYITQPPELKLFETHREYYDIHVMICGRERHDIYVGNKKELECLSNYNSQKDVAMLEAPSVFSSIIISPGEFAVYYPQDFHRPNCSINSQNDVRKICFKVIL